MPETVEEVVKTEEVVPVVAEEPKLAETPKPVFRRVIQPKDEDGKPIGSPHVYTGTSEQEIMDKMADAISNGTLKIRKLTMAEKLRDAKPFEDKPIFQPRELTADEIFKLKNSENPQEAYREIYKAEFGRTPAEDRAAREDTERRTFDMACGQASKLFCDSTPDYFANPANSDAMLKLIISRYGSGNKDWDPTSLGTYKKAFQELLSDGLLETRPEPEPEVVVPAPDPPPPTESSPRTEAPVKREKTAFPSSLSRDQASGTGTAKPKKPSAAEVAMMNAREYKAYLEGEGKWGK